MCRTLTAAGKCLPSHLFKADVQQDFFFLLSIGTFILTLAFVLKYAVNGRPATSASNSFSWLCIHGLSLYKVTLKAIVLYCVILA